MVRTQSNLGFKLMAFGYKFRDLLLPRREILKEARIEPGYSILDYGCGPGGYVSAAAALVGNSGKIYALDSHPLAIQMVRTLISKKQMDNVETIFSDCNTGLPDKSIGTVLLYDVLHNLSTPDKILEELHRVLKPDGILSVSDHHMKENEIVSLVTNGGLFILSKKGEYTYAFSAVTGICHH